jgi:hypothetical protein
MRKATRLDILALIAALLAGFANGCAIAASILPVGPTSIKLDRDPVALGHKALRVF